VPAQSAGSAAPWILGFVPFGGNAPTDASSFEGPYSSKLALGVTDGSAAVTLEENCCQLNMPNSGFTILESGGPNGYIATNSLGTQTSFGTIYMASMSNFTTFGVIVQMSMTISFKDLYDPTQLLEHLKDELTFGKDAAINAALQAGLHKEVALHKAGKLWGPDGKRLDIQPEEQMDYKPPVPVSPPSASPWSGNPDDLKKLQDQLDLLRVSLGTARPTG